MYALGQPSPRAAIMLSWLFFPPVSVSPHFPDEQLFLCALYDSGKVIEVGIYSLKTRHRGHKVFCAQKPHRVLLVSELSPVNLANGTEELNFKS